MARKGLLIVLSGPSGVGKGTVRAAIFAKGNQKFVYSVSATTRKPRPGEVDGKDYFFKSREEFEEMIAKEELLEYANFCNNYYGTPKAFINETIKSGKDIILEIEVQGAMQAKSAYPDAILIFIMPPTFEELQSRLIGRGTESNDVIEARLNRAREELLAFKEYDYIVINDNLEDAVTDIKQIVQAEKLRSYRYKSYIEQMLSN